MPIGCFSSLIFLPPSRPTTTCFGERKKNPRSLRCVGRLCRRLPTRRFARVLFIRVVRCAARIIVPTNTRRIRRERSEKEKYNVLLFIYFFPPHIIIIIIIIKTCVHYRLLNAGVAGTRTQTRSRPEIQNGRKYIPNISPPESASENYASYGGTIMAQTVVTHIIYAIYLYRSITTYSYERNFTFRIKRRMRLVFLTRRFHFYSSP